MTITYQRTLMKFMNLREFSSENHGEIYNLVAVHSEIAGSPEAKLGVAVSKEPFFFEPGNRSESGGRSYTKCHTLNLSYWTSLPSRSLSARPLKSYRNPIGKPNRLPTISFQGRIGRCKYVFLGAKSRRKPWEPPNGSHQESKGSQRNGYEATQLQKIHMLDIFFEHSQNSCRFKVCFGWFSRFQIGC